jgi:hypothetical protein
VDVLIRDVPPEDLDEIKAEAAARGVSLQSYLRQAMHSQAAYLRRRNSLRQVAARLAGQPAVPAEERAAVLDAIDYAHDERAERLGNPEQR